MWDGFLSVDEHYDPIIYEGTNRTTVLVLNGGPAIVELHGWLDTHPEPDSQKSKIKLYPGMTTTISGELLRVHFVKEQEFIDRRSSNDSKNSDTRKYAVVGWRFINTARYR